MPWDIILTYYDTCLGPTSVWNVRGNCHQALVDFAVDVVSDDGYVFVLVPHDRKESFREVDFSGLESKFMYRSKSTANIASTGSLLYYTSKVTRILLKYIQ